MAFTEANNILMNDSSFILIERAIVKLQVYLGRPPVQLQVIALAVCLLLAALIAKLIVSRVGNIMQWINRLRRSGVRTSARTIYFMVRASAFPGASILLVDLARRVMAARGYTTGLMYQFNWVLTTLLFFQLFIGSLYILFRPEEVRRYHFRLFLPLLGLSIVLELLSNLVNLGELAGVVLTTIFGNPITLGALFVATVGLYLWTDAVHGVQDLVYKLITRHTASDPGSTKASLTLVRYLLIVAGVLYALSQLQLDSTTLAAITGGLSVGVGFGLREILSNFISGLLLLFERSLHPGDVIEIDGELSVVENFSIRATTVRTLNNVELVIPNQTFFTSSFKTYTGTDHNVRVPILLRTDCEIKPKAVIEVLINAALSHAEVLKKPPPSVFLLEYGNNVASFQLNIWLDNPVISPGVVSEVKLLAWDAFAKNNIALPFPETEIHFSNRKPLQMLNSAANGTKIQTQTVVAE